MTTIQRRARDGADVTVHGRDAASVTRLAKEVGDIDILVNNAGFAVWGPTETFEIASFDAMFAAIARAPFFLVSALAPGMAARLGLAGGAAYGATSVAFLASPRASSMTGAIVAANGGRTAI